MTPPSWDFSPTDYFRGWIDGDGSLGYTARGLPFVSLTTKSEPIASAYIAFLSEHLGYEKRCNRNKRDRLFNLTVTNEHAQSIAHALYAGSKLRLERKHAAYLEIMKWTRPATMARRPGPKNWWTREQDAIVLNHSLKDAMAKLGRSERSVKMRAWRLGASRNPAA